MNIIRSFFLETHREHIVHTEMICKIMRSDGSLLAIVYADSLVQPQKEKDLLTFVLGERIVLAIDPKGLYVVGHGPEMPLYWIDRNDRQLLPEGAEVFRASGDCLCEVCGKPYREHEKYAYPSGMGHCVRDCQGHYLHL